MTCLAVEGSVQEASEIRVAAIEGCTVLEGIDPAASAREGIVPMSSIAGEGTDPRESIAK